MRIPAGGADEEEPLDAVDEEDLFSAVQREGAEKTKHRQFKEDVQKVPSSKALQTVSGSFFHVDGVGLVDENVVRSNPWMLNKASMQTPQNSGFLSTQPQGAPAAPAGAACDGSMVLSTAPVSQGAGAQAHQASQGGPPGAQASQGSPVWAMPATPQIAPGMAVVLDGLTNTPHFNGLSAMVESYDAETSRYNVQLPIMDRRVSFCCAFEACKLPGHVVRNTNLDLRCVKTKQTASLTLKGTRQYCTLFGLA